MADLPLTLLAAALYLAATAGLVRSLRADPESGHVAPWLALPAVALHAIVHALGWSRLHGPDLHFFAGAVAGRARHGRARHPGGDDAADGGAGRAGVSARGGDGAALPVAGHGQPQALDWRLQLHALLALLAYATLAVSALIAIALWFQDRALRTRHLHGWLRALPPLVQLETLLFRSLWASFLLLGAALLTGILFVQNLLAQHLWHKTVLSVLSWLVLAALLFGRWRFGWRGARAVRLTLVSMALLAMAFFGSKYVLEELLHRAVLSSRRRGSVRASEHQFPHARAGVVRGQPALSDPPTPRARLARDRPRGPRRAAASGIGQGESVVGQSGEVRAGRRALHLQRLPVSRGGLQLQGPRPALQAHAQVGIPARA
jgi:hypothetical protein